MSPTDPHTTTGSPSPWRLALALVAAATVVRAGMAVAVPLVPDETYYWEWSRNLAAGYFDHPPGVAFLIAAGTSVLGATVAGVRVGAVLAGLVASVAVLVLARRLGGGEAALRAAVVVACMPLAAVGLVLATPDAPFLLSASLTFLAVDRALAAPPGSRQDTLWWLAAGLAAGLGFVSKYPAILVPFGITVAMVARPDLRRRLRAPGPWLSAAVALLVFFPVVAWNAGNRWISFAFQLDHGLGGRSGSWLLRELELLGGQLGLASPILFVLVAWALVRGLSEPQPRRFVLAASGLTIFGFFAVSALRNPVEANWPAAAYVPGIVVLATAPWTTGLARWFRRGAVLGAVLVAAAYLQALVPWVPVAPNDDPLGQAHGWPELARAVEGATDELLAAGCPRVWPGALTYQDASQVAFHMEGQPFVTSTNLQSRPNQYDLWPGFADRAAPGDCLVLFGTEPGTEEAAAELVGVFATGRKASPVDRTRRGGVIRTYSVWVFRGWSGDAGPFS